MAIPRVNLNIDPRGYAGSIVRPMDIPEGRAAGSFGNLDLGRMFQEAMRLRNAIAQAQIRQMNENLRRGREAALEEKNRDLYERNLKERMFARSKPQKDRTDYGGAAESLLSSPRAYREPGDISKLATWLRFIGPEAAHRGLMQAGRLYGGAVVSPTSQEESPYGYAEGDLSAPYRGTIDYGSSTGYPGLPSATRPIAPGTTLTLRKGTLPSGEESWAYGSLPMSPTRLSSLTTMGAAEPLKRLMTANRPDLIPPGLRNMFSSGNLGHLFAGSDVGPGGNPFAVGGGAPSIPSAPTREAPPIFDRTRFAPPVVTPPPRPTPVSPSRTSPLGYGSDEYDAQGYRIGSAESRQRFMAPGMTATGSTPEEMARLTSWLNQTGTSQFERGTLPGTVPKTGKALVHKGEIVISEDQVDPELIRSLVSDKIRKLMSGRMDGKGTGPGYRCGTLSKYQEGSVPPTNLSLENPELSGARGTAESWNTPLVSPGGEANPAAAVPPATAPSGGAAPPAAGGGGGLAKPKVPWWWLRMRGLTQGINPFAKNPNWNLVGKSPGVVAPNVTGVPHHGTIKSANVKAAMAGLPRGEITQQMISGAPAPVDPTTLQNQAYRHGTLEMKRDALRGLFGEKRKSKKSYQDGSLEDILAALDPSEREDLDRYLAEGERSLQGRLAAGPRPKDFPRKEREISPFSRKDIRRGRTPEFSVEDLMGEAGTYDPLTSPSSIPPEREIALRPPLGRRVGSLGSETGVTSGARTNIPRSPAAIAVIERAGKIAEEPGGREVLEDLAKTTKNPKMKAALLGLLGVMGVAGATALTMGGRTGEGETSDIVRGGGGGDLMGPPEPPGTPGEKPGFMEWLSSFGGGPTEEDLKREARQRVQENLPYTPPINVEPGAETPPETAPTTAAEAPSEAAPQDLVEEFLKSAQGEVGRTREEEKRGPDTLKTIRETHTDKMDRLRLREEADRLWKHIERNVDRMSPEAYKNYFDKAQRLDRLADVADKRIEAVQAREEGEREKLSKNREQAEQRLQKLREARAESVFRNEKEFETRRQRRVEDARDTIRRLEDDLPKAKDAEWNRYMGLLAQAHKELWDAEGQETPEGVPYSQIPDETIRKYLEDQYKKAMQEGGLF